MDLGTKKNKKTGGTPSRLSGTPDKTAIFIFQRSLRLHDNIGFYHAIEDYKTVIPIFIFTPEQVSNTNKFRSLNAIKFMKAALYNLDLELKKYNAELYTFYGDNIDVLNCIYSKIGTINSIVCNMDYTLYAEKRESDIRNFCKNKNINFEMYEDMLLHPVDTIKTKKDTVYYKYTPFYITAKDMKVQDVKSYTVKNLILSKNGLMLKDIKSYMNLMDSKDDKDPKASKAGPNISDTRKDILALLNNLPKDYNNNRNILSINTSKLSAYIKFGIISIREVYFVFKDTNNTGLISQLFWREFYTIIFYFNKQLSKRQPLNKSYDLGWKMNKEYYNKWTTGTTGFPVVDAGMRELNYTGYMHNRARLITSNFLVKLLEIDWRYGEQYFATKLVDYDPAVNNGNWMWVAGVGVDTKQYYRIFNPWLQSKNYDKECIYIKKWIPELKDIDNKIIHEWFKVTDIDNDTKYPLAMIDYVSKRNEIKLKWK